MYGSSNDNLDFVDNPTIATTQQIVATTIVNDTEIEDNDNIDNIPHKSNYNEKKNRYDQFQPHPDSITPPIHDPFNNNDKRNKYHQYGNARSRQILPLSSSQSDNVQRPRKRHINDPSSLERQYSASDRASDYFAALDYKFDQADSLTPTQPVDGGQIADRFRQRDRERDRKRRMDLDHYNYHNQATSPKRSKYQYINTLKRRPKRPFNYDDV